jgi:hypothetical protein
MANELKDLNVLLMRRADKQLTAQIDSELQGAIKLSGSCYDDSVTIPPKEAQNWRATIDGQPVGERTIKVSHRMFLQLFRELVIKARQQGAREATCREFLQKVDELQANVEELRQGLVN